MKKLISFFILFLFPITTFSGDLNFITSIIKPTCKRCDDGAIIVKIDGIKGYYNYFLFTKEPWKNGKELQRIENIRADSVIFSNLKAGNYYIAVIDSSKSATCIRVELNKK